MRTTRHWFRLLALLLVAVMLQTTFPLRLYAASSVGAISQGAEPIVTVSQGNRPSSAQPLMAGLVAGPVPPPSPVPLPPVPEPRDLPLVRLQKPDQEFWRGAVTLAAETNGLEPQQRLSFQLNGVELDSKPGRGASILFDTQRFPDGIYDLTVQVEEEGLPLAWDRQRLTIDNTPPEVLRAESATDLSAGESGLLEVDTVDLGSGIAEVSLLLPDRVLPMQRQQGGRYGVALPPLSADTDFRIEVLDVSGNRGIWPEGGTGLLRVNAKPEALPAPPAEAPAPLAPVAVVEAAASTQEAVVTTATSSTSVGGTIAADTTWGLSGSPYLVNSSVTVSFGVALTVEPGVVVKFASAARLRVNGTLLANGLAESPIIFTSFRDDTHGGDTNGDGSTTVPGAGNWSYIEAATGGTVDLSYAHVLYGGGSYNTPVLYSHSGLIDADHVTIRYAKYQGVQLNGGSVIGSTIADVGSVGVAVVSGSATVSGNSISSTRSAIQVDNGAPMVSGNQIAANANATGIYLNGGTPTVDGNTIIGRKYGIYYNGGDPVIRNNEISGSASTGIYLYPNKADLTASVTGNTVDGGVWAAYISFYSRGITSLQGSGNLFTGNQYNGYGLGGSFKGTATLPVLDQAYVLNGLQVVTGATLDILPGTVLKVSVGATGLSAFGTVNVKGTVAEPVIVTSVRDDTVGGDTNGDGAASSPAAGDWSYVGSATGGTLTATYAVIRYGGKSYAALYSTGGTIHADSLTVEHSLNRGVQLTGGTLTNSTFSSIGTTAIYVASGSPSVTGNTVNSADYGLHVNAGTPIISGNTVLGVTYGVYVYQSSPVIRNNQIQAVEYGVYVYAFSTLAQPEITGNSLIGANKAGFYYYVSGLTLSGLTLTRNSFTNSHSAVLFSLDDAGFGTNVIGPNTVVGNGVNGYRLGGTLALSSTFYALDAPYVILESLRFANTVVFNPGSVVKLTRNARLSVTGTGSVELRGTGGDKVVLTSMNDDSVGGDTNGDGAATLPAPGDWLEFFVSGVLSVDHASILYGGGYDQNPYHMIYSDGGTLEISNTEVGYSRGEGLDLVRVSAGSYIVNSRIHHNGQYGLKAFDRVAIVISTTEIYGNPVGLYTLNANPYVEASAVRDNGTGVYNMGTGLTPTIHYSTFQNNTTALKARDDYWGTDWVDARFNWWGSDAGPIAGPNGTDGPIHVYPWIGREYTDARLFGSAWWTGYVKGVNMVTGDWSHSVTDVKVEGGKGFPIQITRTYHSLSWTNGSFGHLWSFNYDLGLKDEPTENRVTITYGTGQQARFTANPDGTYTAPVGDRNTLVRTPDGGWKLTTKDYSTFLFDAQGRAVSASDRNGNTSTFTYGTDGKLATITDAAGRQVSITRDTAGRIIQITDPAGKTVLYTYDSAGNLATVTDQMGRTTTYSYGSDHRLLAITRPDNVVGTRIEYDGETRVAAIYDALNNKTTYGYDVTNRAVTVTDPLGNTTRTVYDADLRLFQATDPWGYVATTSYDSDNNIISTQDRAGWVTSYTYDTHHNKTSETDPYGKIWQYTYDSFDNLLTATDPLNGTTAYTYDSNHNRITQADPLNRITQFAYDTSGLLTTVTDPLGKVTSYTYDLYGNPVSMTDPLLHLTQFTYDIRGWRLTTTDPRNGVTSNTYDDLGRLLTATDPLNGTTTNAYDLLGRLVSVTDPELRVRTIQYDAAGRVTAEIDPLNHSKAYTYDGAGNRLTATDELGKVTTYTYTTRNELATVTDPLNQVTTFGYDPNGNQVSVTDPRGHTTHTVYDRKNRLIQVKDHDLLVWQTTEYDALDRVTAQTDGAGRTVRMTYDAGGQMIQQNDPLGNSTTFAYDAGGRKTSQTNALNETTQFGYDDLGRLTSVTLPGGEVYQYGYDALGLMTTLTDPNSHNTQMVYDALGRMTTRTNAAGETESYTYDRVGNPLTMVVGIWTTTWAYDALNRMTGVVAPGGLSTTYTYDAAGQRTAMQDQTGSTTYTYDDLGRLTSITTPDLRTARLTYDQAGNLSSVTDYGGAISTRTYDRRNRLVVLTAADQSRTTYTYDDGDLPLTTTYPNGVTATLGYDGAGRLTSWVNRRADSTTISGYTYTYDALGRKTSVLDSVGLTSYAYDSNDRLQQVTDPDGKITSYTFDGAGNRLTQVVTPNGVLAQTTGYTYDPADRLTQVTAPDGSIKTHTYDDRGNLTDDGTNTYAYDGLNRLVSVSQGGVQIASYSYNGDDLRTSKTAGGQTTRYHWIGQDLWNESDGTSITASNLYGLDLVSRDVGGQTGYYLFNGHQDVTGIVDGAASILADYRYDAYGSLTQQNGTFDNPFRYTGEMQDSETGLVYLRARYYNPAVGRFLTQDTFPGYLDDPRTLNRYVYTASNPVNYVDPSGHFLETLWDAASFGMSAYDCADNPGLGSCGGAVIDGLAMLVPFVPGGVGAARKAAQVVSKIDDVVDAGRAISRADNVVDVGRSIARANDRVDEYIDLYHATGKEAADSIRTHGIDLSKSRQSLDFGPGFYTTSDPVQAADWIARRHPDGEILHFRVPMPDLVEFNRKVFTGATPDWEDFVRHHRAGGPMHGYDVVEGPMLLSRAKDFLKGRPPTAGGHQMSFHTARAAEMLMKHLQR